MIMINLFALFLNALYLIALFNLVASSSLWEVAPSYLREVAPLVFGKWLPVGLWEEAPSICMLVTSSNLWEEAPRMCVLV